MIERKLHYLWIGKNPKPNLLHICLNSWREKLPDYEIIEWNDDNLNLEQEFKRNRYLRECYSRKLWAFLSDYMRLRVLYDKGGIYLDTDMQLLKSLDIFRENSLFLGYEDKGSIAAGIIGARVKHPFLKKMLDFYDKEIWDVNRFTLPAIFTYVFEKYYTDELLKKEGIKIYPREYFYPYHYTEEFYPECIKKNTYAVHWWAKNWGSVKGEAFLRKKHLKGIKKYANVFFKKVRI
ncbi:glycosyltransferase [bacterium]